jgi:hypothetical protein
MLRRTLISLLMATLLWLSGGVTVTPVTDPAAAFDPFADMMPYWYCGND